MYCSIVHLYQRRCWHLINELVAYSITAAIPACCILHCVYSTSGRLPWYFGDIICKICVGFHLALGCTALHCTDHCTCIVLSIGQCTVHSTSACLYHLQFSKCTQLPKNRGGWLRTELRDILLQIDLIVVVKFVHPRMFFISVISMCSLLLWMI